MGLSPKQLKFVTEVLKGTPATEALKRAGYRARTDKIAGANAARLLKHPDVAAAIGRAKAKGLTAADATAERTVAELARVAFFDVRRLFRPDGTLKAPAEWDTDTAAAVASVEVVERTSAGRKGEDKTVTRTRKVKLWDKPGALRSIGQHLKLFTEKVELTGGDGGPVKVDLRNLTDEQLDQLDKLLAVAGGGPVVEMPPNGRDPEITRAYSEQRVGERLAVIGGAAAVTEVVVADRAEAAAVLAAINGQAGPVG